MRPLSCRGTTAKGTSRPASRRASASSTQRWKPAGSGRNRAIEDAAGPYRAGSLLAALRRGSTRASLPLAACAACRRTAGSGAVSSPRIAPRSASEHELPSGLVDRVRRQPARHRISAIRSAPRRARTATRASMNRRASGGKLGLPKASSPKPVTRERKTMPGRPVQLLAAAAMAAAASLTSISSASAGCYSGCGVSYAAPVTYSAPVVYSYSVAAPVSYASPCANPCGIRSSRSSTAGRRFASSCRSLRRFWSASALPCCSTATFR